MTSTSTARLMALTTLAFLSEYHDMYLLTQSRTPYIPHSEQLINLMLVQSSPLLCSQEIYLIQLHFLTL